MKNINSWKPSKYIKNNGKWVPNPDHVGKRYSMYAASLQINSYQKIIRKFASGRLLDCGAGTVPYYGIYKDLVDKITCIDWGDSYHSLDHIDKQVNLTGKLPFKNDSFDTVLLADVIEHLPNPDNIFSEVSRILSRKGRVIIFVPFLYGIHEGPHDYHRYTEYALREYAEKCGLSVEYLEPYGGGPDILIDLGNKMFDKSTVMYHLHQTIWKILKTLGIYKKYHNKFVRGFPFGYSLVASKN